MAATWLHDMVENMATIGHRYMYMVTWFSFVVSGFQSSVSPQTSMYMSTVGFISSLIYDFTTHHPRVDGCVFSV